MKEAIFIKVCIVLWIAFVIGMYIGKDGMNTTIMFLTSIFFLWFSSHIADKLKNKDE